MNNHTLTDNDLSPKLDPEGRLLREVRCQGCRALLANEYIRDGRLWIKCWRCHRINVLVFHPPKKDGGRNTGANKTEDLTHG